MNIGTRDALVPQSKNIKPEKWTMWAGPMYQ